MSLGLPLSRLRDGVSLRLGHAPALTVHRTVIHYRRAASLPDKVSLYSFCKLIASLAGEVGSAVCAEVGGVKTGFIKLSRKPLSHGQAVTAPLKGRQDKFAEILNSFPLEGSEAAP